MALTPKALQVRKIDVGMRIVDDLRRGTTMRDVPEESLMLTGDENIVYVDFWCCGASSRAASVNICSTSRIPKAR